VLGYRLFGANMVLKAKNSYTTYKTMQEMEAYYYYVHIYHTTCIVDGKLSTHYCADIVIIS